MANPSRESSRDVATRGNIKKLWDLICCCSPSTRSPTEEHPVVESKQQPVQNGETSHGSPSATPPQPGVVGKTNGHEPDIDFIDTADSIVTFVLKAVENLGSNLPGIGAVSVVLEAKDKFMTERENREDVDEITKYIEDLCETARKYEGAEKPSINMDDEKFIAELKGFYKDMRINHGWRRTFDIVNADARKKKLEDVWKGIDRAMKKRGLQVKVSAAKMIENVLQKMTEMEKTLGDVHADLSAQAIDGLLGRLELSTAKGARYDSGRTEQTRLVSCTADTRVEVLEKIKGWARGAVGSAHVFWLNGLAGTGKSTIATTIAKWAQEETILGGSFFFSRNVEHLNRTARVFPTLAHQLALFDERYKRELCSALKTAGDVVSANLETQFDALIRKPFAACQGERSILVILDALDECSPDEDVKRMLRLLLQYDELEARGTKLRVFVTSRPESHIRLVFTSQDGSNRHEKVVLHDIDKDTVRKDIERYLTEEFGKMLSGDFERIPPKDWPSSSDFEKVLNKCGEFFAYAATVVRFIADTGIGDPASQLAEILRLMDNPSMTASMNPYHALDGLYLAILEQAARKDPREGSVARIVHVVATVICLRESMTVDDLALFLGMTSDDVRYTLRHLHSVVLVPEPGLMLSSHNRTRFFHQSFPDFLKNQMRCPSEKGFLVDIAVHEHFMGSRCIDLNSLHGVGRYLSLLSYAAKHWISHFQSGAPPDTVVPSEKGSLWPATSGDELAEETVRLERGPQAKFGKPWFERTRQGVLEAVRDWFASRGEDQKHVFWLYGCAYRGHPSIEMYIAKWARDENIPVTCISFGMRSRLETVFLSLVCHLAHVNAEYRSVLYNIAQRDQGIFVSKDYHMQFETLIRQPMALCTRHEKTIQQRTLLVLNGFEDKPQSLGDSGFLFLWTLLHQVTSTLMGSKLRVLIVSEPKLKLRALLNLRRREYPTVSYEFDEYMDRDDIRTFIGNWLQEHEKALPDEQLKVLLDCCGTSFTAARTIIQFIFDDEIGNVNDQLHKILNIDIDERPHTSVDGAHRQIDLDDLYRFVLQQLASKHPRNEDIERIRCFIATIVCLRRTEEALLRPDVLVSFLSMEEDDICAIRHQLRHVEVDTHKEGDLCASLHPSFEEFIQDKERCTDSRFLVDVPAHERFMILRCFPMVRDGRRRGQDYVYVYPMTHSPSHLRSAMFHEPNGDLMQELDLTGLLNDKGMLRRSYHSQAKIEKILLDEDVDIIPFTRELVEKYQPKETETILALLRDAEADKDVAEKREEYLSKRRELLAIGERASQMDSGSHDSS